MTKKAPFARSARMRVAAPLFGVLALATAHSAHANINIVFDYTHDTGFFNSNPARKVLLDAAALAFETRLQDQLTAIQSSGLNQFNAIYFNPASTNLDITATGFSVAQNEVRIFVGADNLGGALGVGGPGGYSISGSGAFVSNASNRGQTAPVDFGSWGGSMSFSNAPNTWYFDTDVSTVESFVGLYDFYSVAVHEIGHVLGMGTSAAWNSRIVGSNFIGPAVGTQALNVGKDHWAENAMSTVGMTAQEAAMTPSIGDNERKYFTTLDHAGMSDIGWQVTSAVPEPSAWLMWGAGGLMVAGLRRRSASKGAAIAS